MKRWLQVRDGLWEFWTLGIRVQIEDITDDVDPAELRRRKIYHIRVDHESVDAANTLRDAKRIAWQVVRNIRGEDKPLIEVLTDPRRER